MNKIEIIKKEFENINIVREINDYKTNEQIKQHLVNTLLENGFNDLDIKNNLIERDDCFTFNTIGVFKQRQKQNVIDKLIIKSKYVIFDKCYINYSDITEINDKYFKTNWATYRKE